jgi:mono/diheme cytochrome c family protein
LSVCFTEKNNLKGNTTWPGVISKTALTACYTFCPYKIKITGEVSMKLCILALLLVYAVFVVGGCSTPANENMNNVPATTTTPAVKATATPDEFAVARANYAKHCSACHGDEGKGGIVKVDKTKLKVPSLREGHATTHPDEKLVKQITNGGDGMPKFSEKLSPEEINAMVRFVRHEFQGK